MKKVLLIMIWATVLLSYKSWSQTPGLIYKTAGTGKIVLDPNGDGYTSSSISGFISSDQLESEIPFKAISIPDIEPNSDLGTGPNCSFGDIVDSGSEDPVFSYLDANNNLLFRFRLGGTATNSKGYSILIDTDQKFGYTGANADPNAISGNPGFEIEIALRTNFGVSLYDIDGTVSSVLKTTLSYDNYAQKSIALSTSCGDADYFYDFFMPFSTINNYFPAITTSTPLRMVAVTSSNASSAIGSNSISDVSGVNDTGYGYNLDNMFNSVVNNFYPTALNSINSGFPIDLTSCPLINNNLTINSTSISGTSTEANGTTIKVYKNTTLLGTTSVSSGTWVLNAVSGLAGGDVITATATAIGQSESFSTCSAVTVAASCSPEVIINASNTNTKNIGGTGIAGALIKVYQNGVLISANPVASATIDGTGVFCWKSNGNAGACNGGSGNLSGSYKVTQTVSGKCESKGVYVCVGTTTQTTTPVISTSLILSTTTSVTGTSFSGANVILFADGIEIGNTIAVGTAWTISGLTFLSGQVITAKAISGTNCVSTASTSKTVTSISAAPVIYGTYCAASVVSSISGSSSEAAGTTIEVFAGATSVGTTTTISGGAWTKTGLSLSSGTVVTAKATASGKTTSAASNSITIGTLTNNAGLSVSSPITEGVTTLSGLITGSGTVKVYIDGSLLGTAIVSGSTWTLSGLASYDIYAGGAVTATITSGANCESTKTASVIISCVAPDASISFTSSGTALCAGSTTSVTLASSQSGLVYQLFNGASASGISVLGTGNAITLTSSTLAASATLLVKVIKVSSVSCTNTLTQQLSVTVTDNITSNTISAPTVAAFCSSGNPDVITGSNPAGGNSSYTYQWQSSNDNVAFADISGAQAKYYDPEVISTSVYYRRIVTSGTCSVTSASILISVQATDLTNTITAPAQINFCEQGDPASITGVLPTGGTGSYTYQWQSSIDNASFTNISGANSQSFNPDVITQNTFFRRLISSGSCLDYPSSSIKFSIASKATTVINSSAHSLIANGTSSATITVSLKDNSGNAIISGCLPILTTSLGSLSAITDHGDGNYSATLTSAITTGTASVTGSINGYAIDDAETITFLPGPFDLSKTTIVATSTSISADGLSHTDILVQLKDANGNNLTTGGETVALSTTLGSLTSVIDQANGTYTAVLTSTTSTGTAVVSGKVNTNSFTDTASVNFIVSNASATQSTISTSVNQITADGISTAIITVRLKDINGNNLTSGGDAVVLSTTTGTLSVVNDNGDGTHTATLTSSTSLVTATITGELNGTAISDDANVQFIPGAASETTTFITSSGASIIANGISAVVITVQTKDANGNNLTLGGDEVILSSTLGTLSTVVDNLDGTYTATLTSATAAGTASITGTLNNNTITNTETVEFIPGAANVSTSTIVASASSIIANGVSSTTITVQLKDVNGNNLTTGGDIIVLSSTLGVLSSLVDHGDGTYTATLTSDNSVGTAVIGGTLNSLSITDDESIQFIPDSSSVSTSIISVSSSSIVANGSSFVTITVQLKDANGNDLTTGGDAVVLVSTIGTLSSVTDNNNGTYSATLTSATAAGTALITGTLNSIDIIDGESVLFIPGTASASTSTISSSNNSVIANGSNTVTITVQLIDAFGNNLTIGGDLVELTSTKGTLSDVVDNNDGTYSAILTTDITTGIAVISGTVNGNSIADNESVNFLSGPANVSTSTIITSSQSITADGLSFVDITVRLKDINGNDHTDGGDVVALSSTSGVLSSVTDNNDGTYSATLTSATATGTATITGTLNGNAITDDATVQFIPGPAAASTSTITASGISIIANGSSTSIVTIALKDVNGNSLTAGGDAIVVATTLGTLSSVTDNGNGTYTATLTSATATGTATITGTLNGNVISDDVTIKFVAGSASAITSTITASAPTMIANGSSTMTITVQLKDIHGNIITIGGNSLTLTTTLGSLSAFSDHSDGTFTATLTSAYVTGTTLITGTLDGNTISDDEAVQFIVGPGSVSTSAISVSGSSTTADGNSTIIVTIQLKDVNGNNLNAGGDQVVLTTTLGTLSSIVDQGDGTYTAILTAGTIAGSAVITVTLNGISMTNNATVLFISVGASTSTSMITASNTHIIADGFSNTTILVQLKDVNGNNITVGDEIITLSTTLGSLSSIIDNHDGTYTSLLTSSTSLGAATISGYIHGEVITDQETVEFTQIPPSVFTSTIAASLSSMTISLTNPVTILVQLKDAQGVNLTTGGFNVQLTTTLGSLSPVTDNHNGTYYAYLIAGNIAGNAVISGSIDGVAMQKIVEVEIKALTILTASISADATEITADGKSTATIIVNVKNQNDTSITDADITFETSAGTLSPVENLNNGNYKTILTSSTIAQTAVINFTLNGTLQSADVQIKMIEIPIIKFFIPEGFSPDGDGVNDTFVIQGVENNPISLTIYNRWGSIVYEAKAYQNDWNGIGNQGLMIGEKLPDGTYFYSVDLNDGSKPFMRFMTIRRK